MDHSALAFTLTTFYHVLADLGGCDRASIISGPHDPTSINSEAAASNNFLPDVVSAALAIPYITEDGVYFAPETKPINYLHDSAADSFAYARDGGFDSEPWKAGISPDDLVLTQLDNDSGPTLIYNVQRRDVTEWNHFYDYDFLPKDMPHHDMHSPQNVLYRHVAAFLLLDAFYVPGEGAMADGMVLSLREQMYERPGMLDNMWGPGWRSQPSRLGMLEYYEDQRKFMDVITASGWDVEGARRELGGIVSYLAKERNVEQAFEAPSASENVWQQIERAREVAIRNFSKEEFDRRKVEWQRDASRVSLDRMFQKDEL